MPTLDPAHHARLIDRLETARLRSQTTFGGVPGTRQPVHVLYGGAHRFRPDTAAKLGRLALAHLEAYAPDAETLGGVLDLGDDAAAIHARVQAKLSTEAVEDLRIDFEDGYGARPDAEEDAHADAVGDALAEAVAQDSLPPFVGIRIKTLTERDVRARALATLDRVLTGFARHGRPLPDPFYVTLPKVRDLDEVAVLAEAIEALESALGLSGIRIEVMIEHHAILFDRAGRFVLPGLVDAAAGRLAAVHFGPFDYTAGFGITADHQRLDHPACTLARGLMQIAFAQTGVRLADGPVTTLALPAHRGDDLTDAQRSENRRRIHDAWRLQYANAQRMMSQGILQGWDLHPHQLVGRYAAVFAFFRTQADAAGERLRRFVDAAGHAVAKAEVFDDEATGQGLLNFFLAALSAGALTEAEAAAASGLTAAQLRGRSFARILREA